MTACLVQFWGQDYYSYWTVAIDPAHYSLSSSSRPIHCPPPFYHSHPFPLAHPWIASPQTMALQPTSGNVGLSAVSHINYSTEGTKLTDGIQEMSSKSIPPKRPHSAVESLSESDDDSSQSGSSSQSDSDCPITDTCDEIRRKITRFLNSGEMKVTQFQRACNINSSSHSRFMKLKGPRAGDSNQTYERAFRFFKAREAAGIKEPQKKKAKKADDSKKSDLYSIELEGEDDESVEIYDTCDDIRRKIAAYLREPNVTQADFLRSLAQMIPDPTIKFQTSQLKSFQTKKGALGGNTSRVYYAAYVFFEKRRIALGKPKSKKRVEMEAEWEDEGGVDRERQGAVLCSRFGPQPFVDEYGKTVMR